MAGSSLLTTENHNPGKILKHFPRLFLQVVFLSRETCKLLVDLQRNALFLNWELTQNSMLILIPMCPKQVKTTYQSFAVSPS